MSSCELISVGIDVGTTTTQIVFSRLTVAETGSGGENPQARYGPPRKARAEVARKEVVYRSPIHFTPFDGSGKVDVEALKALLTADYAEAGFAPQQVNTGAVIITGEASKTQNSKRVLDVIAPLAGDFVVTVAGPSLEAHLAGRGSGAAAWAAREYAWAVNVDIGGGTTNIAIFRQNDFMGSVVLSVGGRHIQVDHATGRVRKVTPSGRKILKSLGIKLAVGDLAEIGTLWRFAEQMADLIVEALEAQASPLAEQLLETPPLREPVTEMTVFISGGVADFYYDDRPVETLADVTIYDDVGPLLGKALRKHPRLSKMRVLRPDETERATVMGASHETITLSGMTIWVAPEKLPMRNVPVVRTLWDGQMPTQESFVRAVTDGYRRWDLDPAKDPVALGIDMSAVDTYEDLQRVAGWIIGFERDKVPPRLPVILVMERDLGKALGQAVKAGLPKHDVLSIDEVSLAEGDYIDIGRSMLGDRLVSLSVKTLMFTK
jgi:ethanolamine utilization protein EutA